MLQHIVNLLQPFAKFTTLSFVVPTIMDLNIHLEEVCYCTLAMYFAYFTVTRFVSIVIMHVIHANVILYTACSKKHYSFHQMKKVVELSEVAVVLQTEIQRHFVKYTAPGISGHNALMVTVTFLDLRYRLLLNPMQSDSAKKFLTDLVGLDLMHMHAH